MKFHPGDRVRISADYNWVQGALGTIGEPPPFVVRLVEDEAPWTGCHRFVRGAKRVLEFFWVNFDELQNDLDGDGPYSGGEIVVEMIESYSEQ
jgi:hypothetical protein